MRLLMYANIFLIRVAHTLTIDQYTIYPLSCRNVRHWIDWYNRWCDGLILALWHSPTQRSLEGAGCSCGRSVPAANLHGVDSGPPVTLLWHRSLILSTLKQITSTHRFSSPIPFSQIMFQGRCRSAWVLRCRFALVFRPLQPTCARNEHILATFGSLSEKVKSCWFAGILIQFGHGRLQGTVLSYGGLLAKDAASCCTNSAAANGRTFAAGQSARTNAAAANGTNGAAAMPPACAACGGQDVPPANTWGGDDRRWWGNLFVLTSSRSFLAYALGRELQIFCDRKIHSRSFCRWQTTARGSDGACRLWCSANAAATLGTSLGCPWCDYIKKFAWVRSHKSECVLVSKCLYIYISGFRNQFQPESAESSRRAFFFRVHSIFHPKFLQITWWDDRISNSDVCRHLTVEKKNTAIAWNYEQCHAEQHGAGRKHDETPQCTGRISVEEKKHSQLRAAWRSERIREYSELHVQHAMIVRQCHYEILSNQNWNQYDSQLSPTL